ncbi:MAG: hypothetical protein MZV64_62860 [Ignavibacteriales bacterium]|nr:hypothetical protein [Ignavibacteriales bacterium]
MDIVPEYQTSPFTHHLTPEMLLGEPRTLQQNARSDPGLGAGYAFGFETDLSPMTAMLVTEAVERTLGWYMAEEFS